MDELHRNARAISETLVSGGYTAYWAGGCVRDRLLGREPKDIDIATTATPAELLRIFPDGIRVGEHFGVIVVRRGDFNYDVATFRREGEYSDGRHPEAVDFCGPEEDSRRRDFTINGLFFDPLAERVIDFVGGVDDLRRKTVRAIGAPADRFGEDHLRMLRAVRFAATLDFEIDPDTRRAIEAQAALIGRVSAERIQAELSRTLLEARRPGDAVQLLEDCGLLAEIMPEISAMRGQEQPPQFHPEGDVFTHTMIMLNDMRERSLALVLAVLLHDVGKPVTAQECVEPDGSTRIRFNRHAEIGAELAEDILKRLRYPKALIKEVCHCIRNHMRFKDVQEMRRSKLRRMLGHPSFPLELELHRLDCAASHGMLENHEFLAQAYADYKSESPLPKPLVNGRDLLDLGIREGPQIGRILRAAYDHQLEQENAVSREEMLEWTRALIREQSEL